MTDLVALRARLEAAVRRSCPPPLANDADDIVQEAMLRVLRADVEQVNQRYLHRVATCATIDALRRRRTARLELVADEDPPDPAALSDPARELGARRLGHSIRECLGAQPDDRRRSLELYLLGHSVSELADLLGIGTKNADNLIYRGLKVLRACLGAKGYAP